MAHGVCASARERSPFGTPHFVTFVIMVQDTPLLEYGAGLLPPLRMNQHVLLGRSRLGYMILLDKTTSFRHFAG